MHSRRFTVPLLATVLVLATITLPAAAQTPPSTTSTACPEGAPAAGFGDVSSGNVHSESIDCLVSNEIVQGTSTDPLLFSPAAFATRAQIATVLALTIDAAGIDLPEAGEAMFEDAASSVHAANIERLAAAGVVNGREDGTFAPGETVTRAQIATMAINTFEFAQGLPQPAEGGPYFDDTASSVHAANIDAARELGLVVGRTESSYEPGDTARRDQLAPILQ